MVLAAVSAEDVAQQYRYVAVNVEEVVALQVSVAARHPVNYAERSSSGWLGVKGSFGWRSCNIQVAREDGDGWRIDCLVSVYAGCYCVSGFETVAVLVRSASHPLDVTQRSVGMLGQAAWEE